MASSLLIYLGSLTASIVIFKKAYRKLTHSRYGTAAMLLVLGFGFIGTTILVNMRIH